MYKIEMIEVRKLHPHPQNPRKDLGDLTELADSIRINGVLQNLTVVERGDGDYIVIIGHRRCAAAKKAECKELPCAVVQMTEHEQLETMLLENMQRSDLTIVEEAQGLQLLIDLGESVGELADKTGFSKTKIRNRLRLNQYKPDSVIKAFSKGATLEDYVKLDKIKDPARREYVAQYLGRSDFNYYVDSEIKIEKFEAEKPAIRALAKEIGADYKETPEYVSYSEYTKSYNICTLDEFKKVIEDNPDQLFKIRLGYGTRPSCFCLYILKEEEEQAAADQISVEREEFKKAVSIMESTRDQLINECKERIYSFVRNFDEAEFCDRSYNVLHTTVASLVETLYMHEVWNQNAADPYESDMSVYHALVKVMGFDWDNNAVEDVEYEYVDREAVLMDDQLSISITHEPVKYLLAIVAGMINFQIISDNCRYLRINEIRKVTYNCTYTPRTLVDLLKTFGFEEPESMQQYIDGTHPMYTEEGCEKIIATALGEEDSSETSDT